jgi:trypsin-like peptidase
VPLLHPNNLLYPVRISIGPSTGSGFYCHNDASMYLATAKHVLFARGLELYQSEATLVSTSDKSSLITITIDCASLLERNDLKKHPTADVAVIKIGDVLQQNKFTLVPGVTAISSSGDDDVGTLVGLPAKQFRRFKDVGISNRAILFAYPGVSLGTHNQIDHRRPLLRQGIIAGTTEDDRIVLDCPSYFGNSGGLVVEIVEDAGRRENLGVGLISEQVPFVEELWSKQFKVQTGVRYENSGYSIAEPMDRIEELLKS